MVKLCERKSLDQGTLMRDNLQKAGPGPQEPDEAFRLNLCGNRWKSSMMHGDYLTPLETQDVTFVVTELHLWGKQDLDQAGYSQT